jgi:hypothetical protein
VIVSHLYNKTKQENENLQDRLEIVGKQRDILSDALWYSFGTSEDQNIIGYTDYYLKLIGCNIDSLGNWSYCY